MSSRPFHINGACWWTTFILVRLPDATSLSFGPIDHFTIIIRFQSGRSLHQVLHCRPVAYPVDAVSLGSKQYTSTDCGMQEPQGMSSSTSLLGMQTICHVPHVMLGNGLPDQDIYSFLQCILRRLPESGMLTLH